MKKIILALISIAAVAMTMAIPAGAASAMRRSAPPTATSPINYLPTKGGAASLATLGKLGSGNLAYHGGPVQTTPRVYLVFWGKWWHSACVGQQGHGLADENYLINFFNARGTGPDLLSNTMTQYHGVPGQRSEFSGKVLYGAVADCSNPPASATQAQLAAVAVAYANYFKAHGQLINANTQIIVVSPSGTNPGGGFGSSYCAWHSWASDGSLELSYTNEPYMPDQGGNCGADFLPSGPSPALQGWSIVGGHEFAESVNDPQLSAWWDAAGFENGDKCAWSGVFTQSIGSSKYVEQPEWSNVGSACALSDGVFVPSPGTQTTRVNHAVSLQIHASATTVYCTEPFGSACTSPVTVHRSVSFTASGLPAGLHISSTGKITGTPTHIATYTVHVTGTEAVTTVHATATFTWKVTT